MSVTMQPGGSAGRVSSLEPSLLPASCPPRARRPGGRPQKCAHGPHACVCSGSGSVRTLPGVSSPSAEAPDRVRAPSLQLQGGDTVCMVPQRQAASSDCLTWSF